MTMSSLILLQNINLTGKFFFDVIYNPIKTKFLKIAEANGAKIINGMDMFVFQALRQHQLWTGNMNAVESDIYESLEILN